MTSRGKGTVTPLSSIFPTEEARKASQRVNDTILEKNKELDTLNQFIDENTNLINLVHRLPDELHHNIMVPFGKAAFFPGRLVHTNEFLVLLGENYFAERTAKQTVDILSRRGKTLNSQVESVKAVIKDLKAEASFFDKTAAEAVEGLVEIREEYTDDEDSGRSLAKADAPDVSEVDNGSSAKVVDDEEYARMMSRLDELEKEELEEEDLEEDSEEHGDATNDEDVNDSEQKYAEDLHHAKELSDRISWPSDDDKSMHRTMGLQPKHKDEFFHGKDMLRKKVEKSKAEDFVHPVVKSVPSESKLKSEVRAPPPAPDADNQLARSAADKRTDNLQIAPDKQTNNKPSNLQPSKPVSRFKMQRRGV
ncbi:RNA polymerase II subunit 5-mediating protein-like protein [Bienertia sinuspersici]